MRALSTMSSTILWADGLMLNKLAEDEPTSESKNSVDPWLLPLPLRDPGLTYLSEALWPFILWVAFGQSVFPQQQKGIIPRVRKLSLSHQWLYRRGQYNICLASFQTLYEYPFFIENDHFFLLLKFIYQQRIRVNKYILFLGLTVCESL